MSLSKNAILDMGFKPICADEAVRATFHSLYVFSVCGFELKKDDVVSTSASVDGVDYAVAVGRSVNQIIDSILEGDHTEDFATWAKELERKLKPTPTYAVIHFGPTSSHSATKGYSQVKGNTIVTYDCFSNARHELRILEAKALPSIEIALTCAFSMPQKTVRFEFVDRKTYGSTSANQTVIDTVATLTGVGYAPNSLTTDEVNSRIQQAVKLASLSDARVSKFFQLGLRDNDDLKRFLYYFLAIEIDVQMCFKRFTVDQHVANGATLEPRVSSSLAKSIGTRGNWKNLADRFVWCVVSEWKQLRDDDVVEFKRLKKIRDGIAHGDVSMPAESDVVAVEELFRKIHTRQT